MGNNYRRNFKEVMSVARYLAYDGRIVPFGVDSLERLVAIVPYCTSLRFVALRHIEVTLEVDFFDGLAGHATIQSLWLESCKISNAGINRLISAVRCMPELEELWLEQCDGIAQCDADSLGHQLPHNVVFVFTSFGT